MRRNLLWRRGCRRSGYWTAVGGVNAGSARRDKPRRASDNALRESPWAWRATMTIYDRALEFVRDGDVLGLGSGRASAAFIQALARRVRQGLRVTGVPTSRKSEDLAKSLGISV